MYSCPNCTYQTETEVNFCPLCGSKLVNNEPAPVVAPATEVIQNEPVQPVQPVQPVTYSYQPTPTAQPQYVPQPQYTPQTQGPSLAMKIVGMALSIGGFFFAFLAFFGSMSILGYDEAFSVAFVYSIFSLPLSIIGLIFSIKSSSQGDTSAFSKVGKIFGIIGLALMGFILFVSLVACA